MRGIPTIHLADYTGGDPSARDRMVRTLGEGLTEFGFLTVEGHGIEEPLIREVYALFRRFFALPDEAKGAYSGIEGGARGFTPMGVEHAKDSIYPDLKEFYHVGQELPPGHPYRTEYAANVWPAEPPELKEPTLALYRGLETCAETILRALAEYFALPGERFASMMKDGNSVLRIIHYPAVSAEANPRSVRAAPHEDINLITLLCEATDSGLEILTRQGDWLPVEALEGQIVVDAGDMLSRVTNSAVPATTHRVVNPPAGSRSERYSAPFFVHPYSACDLTVMDEFTSEESPARFAPITAGQFLEERLVEIGLKRKAETARRS
jgi:isopenicillin N synthase-like dioxygenase